MICIEGLESRALFSAGSLDAAFGAGGTATANLGDLRISSKQFLAADDGKTLVIGYGNSNAKPYLLRYNANGSLDTTFGTGGVIDIQPGAINTQVVGLAVDSSGAIDVAMQNAVSGASIYRYTPGGQADSTFATSGRLKLDPTIELTNLALENDGSMMIAGRRNTEPNALYPGGRVPYEIVLLHIKQGGSIDSQFGASGEVDIHTALADSPTAIVVQANGKVIVAGSIDNGIIVTAFPSVLIQRYNPDGSQDPSFHISPRAGTGLLPQAMTLTTNGKLLIEGTTSTQAIEIQRLTSRGRIDGSFGRNGMALLKTAAPIDNNEAGLLVEPKGKILVATEYGQSTPTASAVLIRLNKNGHVDSGFGQHGYVQTPAPFNTYVTSVLENNGDILLAESQQSADGADQVLAIVAYRSI